MFWRFGISSASTLNTLLDKPDVTPEQVLDDADLLQECKSQNEKLVEYLRRPEVLRRFLEHATGTAETCAEATKENEEKIGFKYPYIASEVLSSDMQSISDALLDKADVYLAPFWDAILSMSPQAPHPVPLHAHPLTAAPYGQDRDSDTEAAADEEGSAAEQAPQATMSGQRNGPGYAILAGYWTKVNIMLLEKHPKELFEVIKGQPDVAERIVSHFDTPAIVDFLFRLVQCDESVPDANIIEWLSDNDLVARTVGLLSPYNSPELHNASSEFLKAVISLSAPSPSSLNQISVPDAMGGPGDTLLGSGCVNNLLVRELASAQNVAKMISFMLDYKNFVKGGRRLSSIEEPANARTSLRAVRGESSLQPLPETASSSDDSAVEDEDDAGDDAWALQMRSTKRKQSVARSVSTSTGWHRDSMATVRPNVRRPSAAQVALSQQALTSSFVNCSSIFIELIRKNNSDYFEQHLFHTLRNYLLIRQQELHDQRLREGDADDARKHENARADDDDDTQGMEEAMDSVAEKMGIVHLGPLLSAFSERLGHLQDMMDSIPAATPQVSSAFGPIEPLTQTRYCIAELYAELLHCSNMALLNRAPGTGPQYSPMGTLLGGIDGLQTLARTLQGDDGPSMQDVAEPGKSESFWQPQDDADDADEQQAPPTSGRDDAGGVATPNIAVDDDDGAASDGAESSSSQSDKAGKGDGDDGEDAKSIASALSNLSLADLVSQFASGSSSNLEESAEHHVAGDNLKHQLLDHKVMTLLLQLFLQYPWNNFLHNVVYDILQQLFNGAMDSGVNLKLTISVFNDARLVEVLLDGARRNTESSQQPRRLRLGYMGHLNLIAEEVAKLLERYPQEVGSHVKDSIPEPAWTNYVNVDLHESRTKEALPLAGGRPNAANGRSKWGADYADEPAGEGEDSNTFASYLSAQMRNETSDDDDEDEENVGVLHGGQRSEYRPETAADDDDWGPFADSNTQSAFEFTSTAAGPQPVMAISDTRLENLTPADWAAEFRREGFPDMPTSAVQDEDSGSDEEALRERAESGGAGSSNSSEESAADDSPYVDLHHPASLRQQAQDPVNARRTSASEADMAHWPAAAAAARKRRTSTSGRDEAAALAVEMLPDDVERTPDGLLRRTLEDGTTVVVPLDDAELSEADPSSSSSSET